jgi:hypothetical protein
MDELVFMMECVHPTVACVSLICLFYAIKVIFSQCLKK